MSPQHIGDHRRLAVDRVAGLGAVHAREQVDQAEMRQDLPGEDRAFRGGDVEPRLQGQQLVQRVREHQDILPPYDDVSHLPAAERDAAALAIGQEDARRAIDLSDAPLFRARIVKLADDNHRLYFTLHHIIFDGVAIYRVIVPELAKLYDAFSRGAGR